MNSQTPQNRLANETSPYLLQHAHQPVDWYPWGPEALDKAVREDKPIFLSIGYSACHWCHVMAHESFDDAETARLMNQWFVNIKVDREERPDVDAVYMKSIVALNGHGGWPMSVFLTPDQKPYMGGTYYPPAPKFNRPGFPQVLEQAHNLYRNEKGRLDQQVRKLLERIESGIPVPDAKGHAPDAVIQAAAQLLAERFDEEFGGFGSGMKFPEPMVYALLLRHWLRTGENRYIEMVDRSLTRMAGGGIYDQIGGGFHRYSTDREWKVPHFEKMLYDNALLARLFLEVFQATRQDLYREIAQEIFDYIEREMTSPDGVFYASQDADTEEGEGHFFTWELKEVLELLGPRHSKVFARAYGMTPGGNFEKRNVLFRAEDPEKIAKEENIAIFEIDHILKKGRETLFEVRKKRTAPGRDEKVIAGWNGMMIGALAFGSRVLARPEYKDRATRAADCLWDKLWDGEALKRVYMQGRAHTEACLEDYAWLLDGFLSLYEATFDLLWIDRCEALATVLLNEFRDEDNGGFFMTASSGPPLVLRLKPGADEAIPSPNATLARALLKLGAITGNAECVRAGRGIIEGFRAELEHRPAGHLGLLAAMDYDAAPLTEIVVSGPREGTDYQELIDRIYHDFRPSKVVVAHPGRELEKRIPLASDRGPIMGKPTVYLCQKQTCHPPVTNAEDLDGQLERPPIIRLNIFDQEGANRDMEKKEQEHFLNAMSEIFKFSGLPKNR